MGEVVCLLGYEIIAERGKLRAQILLTYARTLELWVYGLSNKEGEYAVRIRLLGF
jgi:hypothetical protein